MTTKEYLSQVDRLDKMIARKLCEICELKESAYGIGAISSEERVQTTPNHDPLGTMYVRNAELEEKYKNQIGVYDDLREKIKLQIVSVDNQMHRNVLFAKYVDGKSLERIADEMSRTYKHITKGHGKALMEFEQKYKSCYSGVKDLIEFLQKCD